MTKYLLANAKRSFGATIAKITACDGFPFQVFCISPDLRKALTAIGFSKLPNSPTTVKLMVMEHGSYVRALISGEINKVTERARPEIPLYMRRMDIERYMCLNLHGIGTKFWCLGMIRVYGSLPAEKCIELLEQKLSDYGLQLNTDTVCICTDGASVMMKVGRLIATDQQLCFAHGIQQAVLAVLYKRRTSTIVQQEGRCRCGEQQLR